MVKVRKAVSSLKQKQLLQESDSQCAFCPQRDVSTFEFHHIDEDPSNNEFDNLIVVCSSCHTRITKGILSQADVGTKKRELAWTARSHRQNSAVSVNVLASSFRGDIAQNITKISGVRAPKIAHPVGSIGANLRLRGYVDYLIGRYYEYRRIDCRYGRTGKISHAVLHKNIEREFGAKTFFLPEERFSALVAYLTRHIDNTIQGRKNSAARNLNYHSFEEHCRKHSL